MASPSPQPASIHAPLTIVWDRLAANLAALPVLCYARHPSTGQTVAILRGRPGFFAPTVPDGSTPAQLNRLLDPEPDPRQLSAMMVGCLFGWDAPGAHPDSPVHQCEGRADAQGDAP